MSRRDLILIGMGAVLLIVNMINFNKVSDLQQRIQMFENFQHDIQNVSYSVQDLSGQMDTKLNEFLQEQLWIQEKEYKVKDVDLKKKTMDVVIHWSLKDVKKGEKVAFLFREKGSLEWKEVEAEEKNGLNYSLEHTFSLNNNYESQVVAYSETGQRGENLLELNFEELINNRILTSAFVYQHGNGTLDVNVDIENTYIPDLNLTENIDNLKIKSAKAELYFNGIVVKEIDLLQESEHIQHNPFPETIHYNNVINLKEQVSGGVGDAELHVTVEDGLGLVYRTIGTSEK